MKVTRKVHGELMAARREKRAKKAGRNEKALARFIEINGEIETVLGELHDANCEHYGLSPEEIHWGHVGDANRTLAGLKEILAAIRGEGK